MHKPCNVGSRFGVSNAAAATAAPAPAALAFLDECLEVCFSGVPRPGRAMKLAAKWSAPPTMPVLQAAAGGTTSWDRAAASKAPKGFRNQDLAAMLLQQQQQRSPRRVVLNIYHDGRVVESGRVLCGFPRCDSGLIVAPRRLAFQPPCSLENRTGKAVELLLKARLGTGTPTTHLGYPRPSSHVEPPPHRVGPACVPGHGDR